MVKVILPLISNWFHQEKGDRTAMRKSWIAELSNLSMHTSFVMTTDAKNLNSAVHMFKQSNEKSTVDKHTFVKTN